MKRLCSCLFLLTLSLLSFQVISSLLVQPLNLEENSNAPIGKYLSFYQENTSPLMLDDAVTAFANNKFTASGHSTLNFGIGANPVWLRFEAVNNKQAGVLQRLSVETSWLDSIDVYFTEPGQATEHYHAGDRLDFSERKINNRFFQFDHVFSPGKTTVYIRVQTVDPLVLPIYLSSIDASYARQTFDSYSYGFLYGGILVLLAYNFTLYLSLKSSRYFLYSIYLAFFLLTNAAYTGHGFKYIWPDSPQWQLWSNPVLMILYSVSGLMFALRFLNIRADFPRLFTIIFYSCSGVMIAQLLSVLTSNHKASLLIAFTFMFIFAITMLYLGVKSYYNRNDSAKFFLVASLFHVTGASVTALAVWGFIPYTLLTYRAVDIGMMLDAILLAMALAHQFRMLKEEKVQAEKLAQVDPLTRINNRRAFHEFVTPIWSNSLRNHRNASVVIMDLDSFKLINDIHGHALGDMVLVKVADTLKNGLRAGDILARWGGEEFIIFLPETSREEAVIIAQRFCENIEAIRLRAENKDISITVSIGVADNQNSAGILDSMILEADKYLYEAKSQGRNRVVSRTSQEISV